MPSGRAYVIEQPMPLGGVVAFCASRRGALDGVDVVAAS